MKNTFLKNLKKLGVTVLMVFALTMLAQISVFAQNDFKQDQSEELAEREFFPSRGSNPRALEGSWSVQVTVRNCQTGAALASFPAMNTFMQGGTMQEFSTGNSFLRGPGHGVWNYRFGQRFAFAFQFFRFNADGTYAGLTRARREVEISSSGDSYTATATIEVITPAGIVVATPCATETATRFE